MRYTEIKKALGHVVTSPEDALRVLCALGEIADEAALELEAAWQSKAAGRPWQLIARVVDHAVARLERSL